MLVCSCTLIVTMVMLMFRCNAMVYADAHWDIPIATEFTHCMYDQEQVSEYCCSCDLYDMVSHDLQDVHIWWLGTSQS